MFNARVLVALWKSEADNSSGELVTGFSAGVYENTVFNSAVIFHINELPALLDMSRDKPVGSRITAGSSSYFFFSFSSSLQNLFCKLPEYRMG